MNKQKAFELACLELPENSARKEIIDRAMEIYAAAFAELVGKNNYTKIKNGNWTDIWQIDLKEYTTAELITEFEKI